VNRKNVSQDPEFASVIPSGVSLIELLVVLLLVGILSATAMPTFQWLHRRTRDRLIADNLRQIWQIGRQYRSEFGLKSVPIGHLVRRDGKFLFCGPLRDPIGHPLDRALGSLKCVGDEDYTRVQCGFPLPSGSIHWPDSAIGQVCENAVACRVPVETGPNPSHVTIHL
jgi:prepilin-type N-terminal cleavage/methylation domain-containing protein